MKLIRPIDVIATDNYELILSFNNGEKRVFDVKPYLSDKYWAPLKNIYKFKKVKLNGITAAWDDVIDFCPDELYQNSVLVTA